MPTNVRVIHARDFIHAKPDGPAYIEHAERMLREIVQAGHDLGAHEILIDTRSVAGALSATELWQLAERLTEFRGTFAFKTAILCPLEKFDRSRFFALCAENRGFNVQAFTSYEEAMEWLIGL